MLTAQQPCLQAAAELGTVLRTALGPCGRDKLVVTETGEVVVTSDGSTLLRLIGAKVKPNPITLR